MKTYLVDFENVKSRGLVGIDRLDEDDNVIIFYSENSDTISFEMHCQVLKARANVEYMKVKVGGKNALDFQLSTLLGYIVAKGCNTHVFVISGDKGFDKLHDFWENTFKDAPDCKVFRTTNIQSAVNFARSNMKVRAMQEDGVHIREVLVGEDAEFAEDEIRDGEFAEDDAAEDISVNVMTDETSDIAVDIAIESDESYNSAAVSVSAAEYTDIPDGNGRKVDILPTQHAVNIPEENISKLIPDITDSEMQLLVSLFLSSDSKLELHNELMKHIDNERSSYMYNQIKSSYFTLKYDLTQEHKAAEQPAAEVQLSDSDRAEEQSENDKLAAEYAAEYEREMAAEASSAKSETETKPERAEKTDEPKKQRSAKSEKTDKPAASRKKTQKKPAKKSENTGNTAADRSETSADARKKVSPAEKKKLHGLLDSICSGDEFSIVVSEFNNALTSQQMYIKLTQHFGQEHGSELYNAVKDEYSSYFGKPAKAKRPTAQRRPKSKSASSVKKIDDGDRRLRELAGEQISDGELDKVRSCVTGSDSVRSLYLSLIKSFGKKRGTAIYNSVKNEQSALLEAYAKAAAK